MHDYDLKTGHSFKSKPFCKKGDTLQIWFKGKKTNAKVLKCNNTCADVDINGKTELIFKESVIKILSK